MGGTNAQLPSVGRFPFRDTSICLLPSNLPGPSAKATSAGSACTTAASTKPSSRAGSRRARRHRAGHRYQDPLANADQVRLLIDPPHPARLRPRPPVRCQPFRHPHTPAPDRGGLYQDAASARLRFCSRTTRRRQDHHGRPPHQGMKLREAIDRVLILCPSPLTIQWQDDYSVGSASRSTSFLRSGPAAAHQRLAAVQPGHRLH